MHNLTGLKKIAWSPNSIYFSFVVEHFMAGEMSEIVLQKFFFTALKKPAFKSSCVSIHFRFGTSEKKFDSKPVFVLFRLPQESFFSEVFCSFFVNQVAASQKKLVHRKKLLSESSIFLVPVSKSLLLDFKMGQLVATLLKKG